MNLSHVGLLFAGLACVLCCGVARKAAAQAALPSDTRVVVSGCSTRINERALMDQVRVELLAAGVQRVRTVELYADELSLEEEPADVATLRINFSDCEESGREIKLGVAARHTGRHVERALAVSDVPESIHARAIALALTELLRASWQELSKVESTPEEPSHPPLLATVTARAVVNADAANKAERALRQRPRFEWHGGGRLYPQADSGDVSSALYVSKMLGERTRLHMGAGAAGGGGQGSDAHLFQANARMGLAVCSQFNAPAIEVGSAMELGWAHLEGNYAGSQSGFIATALLQATLRVPAAPEMEALVMLQAGYVLSPPRNSREPKTSLGPGGGLEIVFNQQ